MKVLDTKPGEFATLGDYQIPHGKLQEAKVLHILHWPSNHSPPSTRPTLSSGPPKFHVDAYTLKVLSDMRPTAKHEHVFNDYVPKHMKITNPDGSRCTKDQLYGDLSLEQCVDLMYNLICEADADVLTCATTVSHDHRESVVVSEIARSPLSGRRKD